MSRLIDAESLKQRFERLMNDKSLKEEERIYGVAVTAIKNIIDAHPTAYDVEKVVEKLKSFENDHIAKANKNQGEYDLGCANAYRCAAAVVKKGGIENE